MSSGWVSMNSALACCARSSSPRVAVEPGPLAFEKPSIGFGRVLPGMLSRLQGGSTGLEIIAASVPGEESTVGILDAAEVPFVASASGSESLGACSDGCVHPPSCAGPEVGQVPFEDGLLLFHLDQLFGDVRRDAPEEFSMLGTKLVETLGRSGLVSGPLLAALVIPGPHETLGGLSEVRSGGVDVAGVPGSAHGHVGELPATAVVEDVSDFDRRSLGRDEQ